MRRKGIALVGVTSLKDIDQVCSMEKARLEGSSRSFRGTRFLRVESKEGGFHKNGHYVITLSRPENVRLKRFTNIGEGGDSLLSLPKAGREVLRSQAGEERLEPIGLVLLEKESGKGLVVREEGVEELRRSRPAGCRGSARA